MLDHKLRRIRHKLANHQPAPPPVKASTRAAVALLLQPQVDDLQMLFIHRAHHPQDPWSGHMAFPGGRKDPEDVDLRTTIHRETKEEVGIDLNRHGEYLGRMAELQAMARGRPISMTVAPFVYFARSGPRVIVPPAPAIVLSRQSPGGNSCGAIS